MAERRKVIREFVAQGIPVAKATEIAVVPKSSYYYRANGKRKGRAPSTHTLKDGTWVENTDVLREIEHILEAEFIEYGYHMVTDELRNRGYHINPKKVYRLMKENRLLNPSVKAKPKDKTYVQYTSPRPQAPFGVIEVDIKYIHIHGQKIMLI